MISIKRFGFWVVLSAASALWAYFAISAQSLSFRHYDLITAIRSGAAEEMPKQAEVDAAIVEYELAVRQIPCNVALYTELALLSAQGVDLAMAKPYTEGVDGYLEKTMDTLAAQLACTPTDGKAWLDYALSGIYREGFTERSLEAYKLSARVTPGESWLAEKRMLFALKFRPFFDKEALAAAQNDLTTLERAHPNRMAAVLKSAELDSADELRVLFARPIKY